MTLSSTEARLGVLSKAVKQVMFIVKLLQSMKISVKLLVMVIVDNIGAVAMVVKLLPQLVPSILHKIQVC